MIITKSTVAGGTGDIVAGIVSETLKAPIAFERRLEPSLREGSVFQDFQHPDWLVLDAHSRPAAPTVAPLLEGLPRTYRD
jgi:UDP-glucose 6-dehydrogenase